MPLGDRTRHEWDIVKAIGPNGIKVSTESNIIVGGNKIAKYIHVSLPTLMRWITDHGFPAIQRPDGLWISSVTSIDQWIWMTLLSQEAARAHKHTMPSTRALRTAKATGLISEVPSYNSMRSDYKKEWRTKKLENLCSDCPPVGYETSHTRCKECPRGDNL